MSHAQTLETQFNASSTWFAAPEHRTAPHAAQDAVVDLRRQIDSVLGTGAAAVVYAARNQQDEPRALKVLKPQAAQQPSVMDGFQREFRALSQLRHPNILRAYSAGKSGDHIYMMLERVQGETLGDRLARRKTMSGREIIDIGAQLAGALDYVHARGFVHRDVKPDNVLLADDGRVVLFDFGAAMELEAEMETTPSAGAGDVRATGIFGTPAFAAPEQIDGRAVDGRADVYALGITLYRMATGRKPFYGSRAEVLDAHLHQEPPAPSRFAAVSPDLERVILRCLAKDPAQRYQSGAELASALAAVTPLPTPTATTWGQRIRRVLVQFRCRTTENMRAEVRDTAPRDAAQQASGTC